MDRGQGIIHYCSRSCDRGAPIVTQIRSPPVQFAVKYSSRVDGGSVVLYLRTTVGHILKSEVLLLENRPLLHLFWPF